MRILQVLIFGLPWVVLPGTASPYLEAKEAFLMAGLWAILLWGTFHLSSNGTPPENRWWKWSTLYLITLGFTRFAWPFITRTPQSEGVVYNVYIWLPIVNVVIALLTVRALATAYFRTPVAVQVTTQWWCLSAFLTGVYAFLQFLGLDQFYVEPTHRNSQVWKAIQGSFGNPEHLSLYLALLLPLYLLFRPKRYLLGGFFLLLIIHLTHHGGSWLRGDWLIALIGVSTYGLCRIWPHLQRFWQRLIVGGGLALSSLAGLIVLWPRLAMGDERLNIWQQGWALLQAYQSNELPRHIASFTGRGLGTWNYLMRDTIYQWAHNEWLHGMVEVGVIGITLAAFLIWSTTKRAWRRAQGSLLDAGWLGVWVAWLSASFLYPVAHWPHLAWVGLCTWGVLEREEA